MRQTYTQKVHSSEIIFNCSRREAIIVNVCIFYAKFLLDGFDFSSDFYALDFLRFA